MTEWIFSKVSKWAPFSKVCWYLSPKFNFIFQYTSFPTLNHNMGMFAGGHKKVRKLVTSTRLLVGSISWASSIHWNALRWFLVVLAWVQPTWILRVLQISDRGLKILSYHLKKAGFNLSHLRYPFVQDQRPLRMYYTLCWHATLKARLWLSET